MEVIVPAAALAAAALSIWLTGRAETCTGAAIASVCGLDVLKRATGPQAVASMIHLRRARRLTGAALLLALAAGFMLGRL